MGCSSCGKKVSTSGNKSSQSAKKAKTYTKTYVQNGKRIKVLVYR